MVSIIPAGMSVPEPGAKTEEFLEMVEVEDRIVMARLESGDIDLLEVDGADYKILFFFSF